MERLAVRALRAGLAAAVRRAGDGQRIIITVDGAPVAQLGPIEAPGQPTIDDLVARGLVERARRDDRPAPTFVMPVWAGTRLDRVVGEVRGR